MAFLVVRTGGKSFFGYAPYFRLLQEDGVDLANAPRGLEPSTGDRWLYAWDRREDAEQFIRKLRKRPRQVTWRVEEVPDDRVSVGPLGPVEIEVTPHMDGFTYGLSHYARTLIGTAFPEARPFARLSIGVEPPVKRQVSQSGLVNADFQDSQPAVANSIAMLLTGLRAEQLDHLGGYRIFDPVTEETFLRAYPEQPNRRQPARASV